MKNIIVFGFSVTGDKPGFLECWEDGFGSQHRDWNVSRVAIGGLQPDAGRHLVPSIIEERKPDYIIFEIATAISRISRLTREKLTGHIDTINFLITLCQERSIKCGFLDLPQEGIDPDRDWMLDIHKDIFARCGIPHLVKELEPNTLRDNVHPNSFGRKLYAAALERILCEVEASSTASYHLAKSGKRFEALPATQAVVGNYDYEVFERRGFKADIVKIQARQNQLFRVFEGAVTVGFIVVMGPKTGYMKIDLDGVSRRISAFDRHCYYTRLGGRNVVRSNCRLIHITQLADQPKEPLLKGEKVITERQGGVAFILIEIEEALSREYILADKKIKDFFLGKYSHFISKTPLELEMAARNEDGEGSYMTNEDIYTKYKFHLDRREWQDALEIIETYSSISDRNRAHRSLCLMELARLDEAKEQINEVIQRSPSNPWFRRIEAELLWRQSDLIALENSIEVMLSSVDIESYKVLKREAALGLARLGEIARALALLFETESKVYGDYFRLIFEANSNSIFSSASSKVSVKKQKIPKRILQFWDKSAVPSEISEQMNKWKTAYPDFEYVLHNEQSAIDLCSSNGDFLCAEAIKVARHPAQKSDIFRLYFINKYGGIYLDADEIPSGDMREILSRTQKPHIFWMRSDQRSARFPLYCTNWFIAAAANTDIVSSVLGSAIANTLGERENKNVHIMTGPFLLTKHIVMSFLANGEIDADFLMFEDGRRFICKNIKWKIEALKENEWQDYAGVR